MALNTDQTGRGFQVWPCTLYSLCYENSLIDELNLQWSYLQSLQSRGVNVKGFYLLLYSIARCILP